VGFNNVSTIGLEASPVASALAGLRANESLSQEQVRPRFTVEPANKSQKTIDWVHRILKDDPDPLHGSDFATGCVA
jgi:hypothetical protein